MERQTSSKSSVTPKKKTRKRPRYVLSPTKRTPTKPKKKLFASEDKENIKPTNEPWSHEEEDALYEYINNFPELVKSQQWPRGSNIFWSDAALKVAMHSVTGVIRTGDACRRKAVVGLKCLLKQHRTTEVTEEDLHQTATSALQQIMMKHQCLLPRNFTRIILNALILLQNEKEPDVLTGMAVAIASKKLQLHKMPYVMFKHHIMFINADYVNIACSKEYWQWIETMYTNFGGKFLRLFRGPFLHDVDKTEWHPSKARVNVACPGQPAITTHMNKDNTFHSTTDIQVAALKEVSVHNPGGRYWILSDATDVKTCLQESRRQDWHGDVDLNDGELEKMKAQYDNERQQIQKLVDDQTGMDARKDLLERELKRLNDLKGWLKEGVTDSTDTFNEKVEKKGSTEAHLMKLCWNMTEWEILKDQTEEVIHTLAKLKNKAAKGESIVGALTELKEDLLKLHMNTYKKKRIAASHVLVFYIAHEELRGKPYGIPVRFLACNVIRDKEHRELVDEIKEEMVRQGITPVGSVSDGEYHSTRYSTYQGQDVSVFGIIQECKETVETLNKRQLMGMILPREQRGSDGQLMPIVENDFVPQKVLQEVYIEMQNNPEFCPDDLVDDLKDDILPKDYKISSWKPGAEETLLQSLRTLIATYMYIHRLNTNKLAGRDFTKAAYIPPVDKTTGTHFHNRGDHLHIDRRIAMHTRAGGNGLRMEAFVELLTDKEAGLTEAALKGHDKQSTTDAEALLSYSVASALERKGYPKEAEYVKKVAQWHEAADGRAAGRDLTKLNLTEEEEKEEKKKCQETRVKYNMEMVNYIVQEWMPWQGTEIDYRLMDINKPLKGILGWSRETVIDVLTNIYSQEFRRQQSETEQIPPEHPRAGTTNIVEAAFAQTRSCIGGDSFTLKQFRSYWRSHCREICKMMDPDLSFHYSWPTNRCNEEGVFDGTTQGNPLRLHCIKTKARNNAAIFCSARGSMAVQYDPSMRKKIYKKRVPLPAVPGHKINN